MGSDSRGAQSAYRFYIDLYVSFAPKLEFLRQLRRVVCPWVTLVGQTQPRQLDRICRESHLSESRRVSMGRPSKGERDKIHSRVPVAIKAEILKMMDVKGISESDCVSDLLAIAVGRPDLVFSLNQEVLQQTA